MPEKNENNDLQFWVNLRMKLDRITIRDIHGMDDMRMPGEADTYFDAIASVHRMCECFINELDKSEKPEEKKFQENEHE